MRRPTFGRINRRSAALPNIDFGPMAILGGGSILQWIRADNVVVATGVSVWPDMSGHSNDYTQGVGSTQPAWSATSGPNNTPAATFDGVDDRMVNATLNLAAPGTTPSYFWIILKMIRSTGFDTVIDDNTGGANRLQFGNNNATPAMRMANTTGSNVNGGLANNTWGRAEIGFTNSASDFLKLITTNVTGGNAGNNVGAGRILGTDFGRTLFANVAIAELFVANRIPTAGERSALDAYCTSRYGAGLV